MKNIIRKNSVAESCLAHLIQCGMIRKTDLYLFMREKSSVNTATSVFKTLKDSGLINIRELTKKDKSYGERVDLVYITKKGKTEFLNLREENEKYDKIGEHAYKRFKTSDPYTLELALDDSTVKTMMSLVDVPCFMSEKPSLNFLYAVMTDTKIREPENAEQSLYASMSKEGCLDIIKNSGVYYSSKEWRDFISCQGETSNMEINADTLYGSRIRGVYIRYDKAAFIYVPDREKNKLLKVRSGRETLFIESFNKTFGKVPSLKRSIPSLTTKRVDNGYIVKNAPLENSPIGIVLSNGDRMTYSMVSGRRFGKIPGESEKELKRNSSPQKTKKIEENGQRNFLIAGEKLFRRLFVIPQTENGVASLDYVLHTSAEDWLQDSINVFSQGIGFTVISSNKNLDPKYVAYSSLGEKAIFLPAYEVNILTEIKKSTDSVCVATYKDLANGIARSVCKEISVYDAGDLTPIRDLVIYDQYGYPAGEHKVQLKLIGQGFDGKKMMTKEMINKIPQVFHYDNASLFWNDVYKEFVNVDTVVEYLKGQNPILLTKDNNTEPSQKRTRTVTINVPEDFYKNLKKAVKGKRCRLNTYVMALLKEQIEKDATAYDEELAKNKEIFSQI